MNIKRECRDLIERLKRGYPIIGVLGPRQSGKTTLVKHLFINHPYVNLEDLETQQFAKNDPKGFLQKYRASGAILDEIQRVPELFNYLQVLVDEEQKMGHFIISGSENLSPSEKISQSLAGRIALIDLLPFTQNELLSQLPVSVDDQLWKGGYPPLYSRELTPNDWYGDYIRNYIEKDVRQLLKIDKLHDFQRFLRLCAARTGQVINYSDLARDASIDTRTAKSWLSILEASYILFTLAPYYKNFSKRVTKQSKIYFYDTGIVCYLLGIKSAADLNIHQARGQVFETYVVSEIKKMTLHNRLQNNLYFWRDQKKEIDLYIETSTASKSVEIKSSMTYSSEHVEGIKYFNKLHQNITNSYLVNTGSVSTTQQSVQITPWNQLKHLLDC